jgi:hypothetical protein
MSARNDSRRRKTGRYDRSHGNNNGRCQICVQNEDFSDQHSHKQGKPVGRSSQYQYRKSDPKTGIPRGGWHPSCSWMKLTHSSPM